MITTERRRHGERGGLGRRTKGEVAEAGPSVGACAKSQAGWVEGELSTDYENGLNGLGQAGRYTTARCFGM